MLGLRSLHQKGDTIIEVMVALAILGSALSLGYATASHALTTARASQEHSQAQQYLDTQAELLRQAAPAFATPASDIYTATPRPFCLVSNGTDSPVRADFAAGYSRPADATADTLISAPQPTAAAPYPDTCVLGNGRYFVSIVYTADTNADGTNDDLFTIIIRWEGLGSLSRQQASMTYKIHEPTAGGGSIGGNGTPPPAPGCPAAIPTNKFQACYFADMNQVNFKFQQMEAAINHDWGTGSPDPSIPADNFSANWKGSWDFASAGNYTFTATGDDGIRVKVDGATVIDKYFDQGPTTYNVVVNLSAGKHTITMDYYENGGGAVAKLSWVAGAAVCPAAIPTFPQFQACYYNDPSTQSSHQTNFVFQRLENSINNDWGAGGPGNGVGNDYFSAQWKTQANVPAGNYTYTVTADDGVRLTLDGQVILDKYFDQGPTTYTVSRNQPAGLHNLVMDYYENAGGATAKLSIQVTQPNVITQSTPIVTYQGCTTQSNGQSLSAGFPSLRDNDDNTGIVTNCGQDTSYVFDLGASYRIDQINVNWGPNASNIQKWQVAVTAAGGGPWCEFVGDSQGFRYTAPATNTSDKAANAYCHNGGSMNDVQKIWIVENGANPISLNEVRAMGVKN